MQALTDSKTNICTILQQYSALMASPWRFRAYLERLPDGSSAGWHGNAMYCPLAAWFLYETGLPACVSHTDITLSTDITCSRATLASLPPPPWIVRFIGLVDSDLPPWDYPWIGKSEALAAFAIAERETAQLLLPALCESRQCVHVDRAGQRCAERGLYAVHAFVGDDATGPTSFREVNGLVCEEHWGYVVVPPKIWWQHVEDDRLLAFAEAR